MGHNIAVQEASNEHIVSTDFGVRFDPHWFEEIVRPYEEDPTVEIVAGSYEIDFATLHGPTARAEWYLENGGVPKLLPGFVPGNRSTAYTKSVWRKLGGLPQDLTFYADDSVFGMQMVQAGFKMAYAPKAVVYWSRPAKLKAFWKEQYNYCRGDGEAAIKTPVAFRWYKKGLIPAWMVPLLTAIRTMTGHPGHKVKAAWRALRKGDVLACLFMPVLTFGNGYCGGKGYLVGYSHGEAHCQQCRSRLAESSDSPSSVAAPRPVPER
jgi:cellulose synthase/poly-beta-1,6-N-acetylglucosamine synthase-like glycosyltransferase